MFHLKRDLQIVLKHCTLILAASFWLTVSTSETTAQDSQTVPQRKIVIQPDGTVEAPARTVPPSALLTSEAKAYMSEHLHDMQNPEKLKAEGGVPAFMKHYLEHDVRTFALDKKDKQIAGVHVYDYTPKAGVSARNKTRVLINLHGGGFTGCWPACAELESIPLSSMMGIRVISVDYREGPTYKFPAASEDVAKVYQDLLKTYKAKNIGIYGCSAGGMLTAMSLAWFQTHGLPAPGAAGIYCAGAGSFNGDAAYIAFPLGESRIPSAPPGQNRLGYFSTAKMDDPLVSPANSPEVLAKFPPTLLITATRDFAMSAAVSTDVLLTKAGVDSELHVWDGLFHGFFYNSEVPESKDAFDIMAKFFDRHLAAQ